MADENYIDLARVEKEVERARSAYEATSEVIAYLDARGSATLSIEARDLRGRIGAIVDAYEASLAIVREREREREEE